MTTVTEDANETLKLVSAMRLLLANKSPQVQGAALADLLATWLAGHVMLGDPKKTKRVREEMLKLHLKAVKTLIEPNYKMSVEPQIKARTQ